ncbi:MAG TPA: N-formylglutamate deformylase [Rhizomicrobium sp.]|jgi:N-formylglutamate deformylase|nr:N-formylglutamate deformylase [Rhizomicrobium sp.]
MSDPSWLALARGSAPLIVSMPHTGNEIPDEFALRFISTWLARKDTDWWIERLYDFAGDRGATVLRTTISRSVIDVNRDPAGRSLYPGQATTELCPTTSFDGEKLYHDGLEPDEQAIARRREQFFEPYHATLKAEIARLRETHPKIVLFEAHSIRSNIPRLFEGELPNFNLGTNSGASCAAGLTEAIERACDDGAQTSPLHFPPPRAERAGEVPAPRSARSAAGGSTPRAEGESNALAPSGPSGHLPRTSCGGGNESGGGMELTRVTNGRFGGGYTTRHYGDPARGVHAVQLELAMRGYMDEPQSPSPDNWPSPYDPARAAPLREILQRILETCLTFASQP